jgi:hypothetical protein
VSEKANRSERPYQIFLTQNWDAAWREVVSPWLAFKGELGRYFVAVPTRGQAEGLKTRAALEKKAFLGVEFLSPNLVRRKWLRPQKDRINEAADKRVLVYGLRMVLEKRLRYLPKDHLHAGLIRSLLSYPEQVLGDWEGLIAAGYNESSFPLDLLKGVFAELREWCKRIGIAPMTEVELEAGTDRSEKDTIIADRLLIYGFSAESWLDFFNLAALARRAKEIVVVLPYPEFEGKPLGEAWIDLWQDLLGVEAESLPDSEGGELGKIAELWVSLHEDTETSFGIGEVPLLVGQNKKVEMRLAANQIIEWLADGAKRIAAVFPSECEGKRDLLTYLEAEGIGYTDLIGDSGSVPLEINLQQAILQYHKNGHRLDDLWIICHQLRPFNRISLSPGESRRVIESVFEECYTHSVEGCLHFIDNGKRAEMKELARVVHLLGIWPFETSLADALRRFTEIKQAFGIDDDGSLIGGLERLASVDEKIRPLGPVIDLLIEMLPESTLPAASSRGRHMSRVVVTTRHRAVANCWSHVLFVGSNAEVWPVHREETFWLPDRIRGDLNKTSSYSLGLFLSEDYAFLEKAGYLDICRNTCGGVALSASLHEPGNAERQLSPNRWMEQLLLVRAREDVAVGGLNLRDWSIEKDWIGRAVPDEVSKEKNCELDEWDRIRLSRMDPEVGFDQYFYCHRPDLLIRKRWPAGLLERGVKDPVELWYSGVLGLRRISHTPLLLESRKLLGLLAHRFLAFSLRGEDGGESLVQLVDPDPCRDRLANLLANFKEKRLRNVFWESFTSELTYLTVSFLEKVLAEIEGLYIHSEYKLPSDCQVLSGKHPLGVSGRIDLLASDRMDLVGAKVLVCDFKTGRDAPLSPKRMASSGDSLQLGIYLEAMRSLGAIGGEVRMVKASTAVDSSLSMDDLEVALGSLERVGRYIFSGCYGQLTPNRTAYASGFELPLACVLIPADIRKEKYEKMLMEMDEPKGGVR